MPTCLKSAIVFKAVIATAMVCLLGACSSAEPKKRSSLGRASGPIEEVHLFGFPVPLNTDALPGPDAVGVRVYVSNRKAARGLAIKNGHLEMLMFKAPMDRSLANSSEPLRVWKFTPTELKSREGQTTIGIGYRLALPLEGKAAPGSAVTLIARYVDPKGRAMESSPSTISLQTK